GASALAIAKEYKPDILTLDIFLPDIEGWRVLERLKNDIQTRHLPVCVISTDDARQRALSSGALAFVAKPIKTREEVDQVVDALMDSAGGRGRRVRVGEDNPARRERIFDAVADERVRIDMASDGREALNRLRAQRFDCVIVGSDLKEATPDELAAGIRD